MRGLWSHIAVLVLVASVFTHCGGQNSTADRRAAVLSTQNFSVAAGDGTALSVDVPSAGALAATANWAGTSAEIDVYITDSTCPGVDELVLGSCAVLARGDTQAKSPQTATAFGVRPGRYQALVLGVGQNGGSGTVQFALSP